MNLLQILLDARDRNSTRGRSGDDRKARRRARPGVDRLEKREVFTTGFVGPLPAVLSGAPAAVSSTSTASTTTITQDQQGTAFGMNWCCTYDSMISQYHLDIEGAQGIGTVSIARSKVGLQFSTTQYNSGSGKGNSPYNGGINVFVPGRADASITVVIKPTFGGYTMTRGNW